MIFKDKDPLLKEITYSFFSVFAVLFLEGSTKFFENVYLCRYSPLYFNASIYAFAFLKFLQNSLISFANTTSLFENKFYPTQIGNRIWQVIWLSLFSMLIIFPLSFGIDKLFFKPMEIGQITRQYFFISMYGIFLFPMVAILSSFFRAQGKKNLILNNLLITFVLTIFLNLSFIPRYEIIGAAFSSLICKGIFFFILFAYFLNKHNRENCGTNNWKIDWISIWKSIQQFNPRLIGNLVKFSGWMILTIFMAKKGNLYLSSLSVGTALTFFCMSIQNSLCYTFTHVFHKRPTLDWNRIFRIGIIVSLTFALSLSLPCILFPKLLLSIFYRETSLMILHLYKSIQWVGVWIFTAYLYAIPLAFLTSKGEEFFYLKIRLGMLILNILQTWYFIQYMGCECHVYWIILSIENIILFLTISSRAYVIRKNAILNFKTSN